MRENEKAYRGRLSRFLDELIRPNIYGESFPLKITAWQAPGEPVRFDEAIRQTYTDFSIGSGWARGWGTTWFHVTGQVPEHLIGHPDLEIVVDLGFRRELEGGQGEGLAFRPDGTIIKAIEPFNRYLPVEDRVEGRIDFYLEAAANPEVAFNGLWQPSLFSTWESTPEKPLYKLRRLDGAIWNREVWELNEDFEVASGLVEELPADLPRRACLVVALNRAMDAIDPRNVAATAVVARTELAEALSKPAYASAHQVVATGHAHIDSAWLWPIRETIRKCARTFANAIELLDRYPDLVFSASSAQQYLWIRTHYPQLWTRIKQKVAEKRFVPIGGMWVEPDANLPGSEAMARQFILGKGFFIQEFGVEPLDVWLPDSFGYSGALPQIAKAAGSKWFLTQKMSWNQTNSMPHHSFWWEGIDGSRIFTHMPPVDTYNSKLSAAELALTESQYREQGHGTLSLVPFGYGDGGGGPTREMVAKAHRTANLEGSARVQLSSVADFFARAEAELTEPGVWVGEMYLEAHRGTSISQLRTKQGNRRCEHLLQAAEAWATTAAVRVGAPYPRKELEQCWQTVLLHQFHDILPGTSIGWVHREVEAGYERVASTLNQLIKGSTAALVGEGDRELAANSSSVTIGGIPAFSISEPNHSVVGEVEIVESARGWVFDTGLLRVALSREGMITQVEHQGRELVPDGRNFGALQLHVDRPAVWDAWDIDEHISRVVEHLSAASTLEVTRDAGRVLVDLGWQIRDSRVNMRLTLSPGSANLDFALDLDWHEQRTLLQLVFPTTVFTTNANSEIQFGHIQRPIHTNTSWDQARFETCAHRWVQVSEPGYGLAIANDSTYGHAIHREAGSGPQPPGATIGLSLIRGSRFPDPEADQGKHQLKVRVVCGATIADAQVAGRELNQPIRLVRGAHPVDPLVQVVGGSAVVETMKLSEDGSGDVILRIYESLGQRTEAVLATDFAFASVVATDLLERLVDDSPALWRDAERIGLKLNPFQIVTLRFVRDNRT